MIEIYDDVLSDELLLECRTLFRTDMMNWHVGSGVAYSPEDEQSRLKTAQIADKISIPVIPTQNNVYMTNNLYDMYDGYQKLYEGLVRDIQQEVSKKISIIIWMRFKVNLMMSFHEKSVYGFHKDCVGWLNDKIKHSTAVLYLDSNDGGTMFEDGRFVESKSNRLVVFPNSTLHSSVSQTDDEIRTVINLNFITGDEGL